MSRLENVVVNMGFQKATESLIYMNIQIKLAWKCEAKAQTYPEQRFYPAGHPRKLAIEKRNEHYNAVIDELRKWIDADGNLLFNLPPLLRVYQESPNAIYDICKELVRMEHDGEMDAALRMAL